MPDEEAEGFTVRDRRRFTAEDSPAEVAPAQPAPPALEEFAAEGEEFGEQDLPDVYSILALFLGELRNMAWLRMGLVANPGTGEIEPDLAQAKVAIDTVAFLAGQLDPVVAPEERLPLKAMVSDLQVTFLEQSRRGSAGN